MERLPGVKRARVSLEQQEAQVEYDDGKITPEKLVVSVGRLGYQASLLTVTAAPRPTLYVEGLSNLTAVRKVEEALRRVKGVTRATVYPRYGEVFVEYNPRLVRPEQLRDALRAVGIRSRLAP